MDQGTAAQLDLEDQGKHEEAQAIQDGIETNFLQMGQELGRIEARIDFIANLNFVELGKRIQEESSTWSQEREKYRTNLLRTGPFQPFKTLSIQIAKRILHTPI